MVATERLYYHDSRLLEFDARVTSVSERDDGQIAVTLDRTAFYPTGGGQPFDTGLLGAARVVDCVDLDDAGVLHLIQGPVPEIGDTVHGKVDWSRRLDHLQQHTGQHILSQAFIKLFKAPTHSFRMLEHECEIDVALEDPTDEKIEQAVDLANQVIWESRAISVRQVSSAEAAALPLRKEPAREGELRLIEIDDFDLTPCGGTHAKSTGEVGVIAVRSWERAKGLIRVQFMAGIRVLADYRKANQAARATAALFSAGREDSPVLVAKIIDDNKALARRVSELEEIACRVEAEELLREASRLATGSPPRTFDTDGDRGSSPTVREGSGPRSASDSERGNSPTVREGSGPKAASDSDRPNRDAVLDSSRGLSAQRDTPRPDRKDLSDAEGVEHVRNDRNLIVIAKVFDDRSADSLKRLALALIAYSNVVALLGSRDSDTARLVFARSPDAIGDMNTLMREACSIIGGRCGGKADMAQGGGKKVDRLADAIESSASLLGARTSRPH